LLARLGGLREGKERGGGRGRGKMLLQPNWSVSLEPVRKPYLVLRNRSGGKRTKEGGRKRKEEEA